jgi:hypothetical protein
VVRELVARSGHGDVVPRTTDNNSHFVEAATDLGGADTVGKPQHRSGWPELTLTLKVNFIVTKEHAPKENS